MTVTVPFNANRKESMFAQTEFEMKLFFSSMFHEAPVHLCEIVSKCHNPDHVIPEERVKKLSDAGLLQNGAVAPIVQRFVLNKIKLGSDGGFFMAL